MIKEAWSEWSNAYRSRIGQTIIICSLEFWILSFVSGRIESSIGMWDILFDEINLKKVITHFRFSVKNENKNLHLFDIWILKMFHYWNCWNSLIKELTHLNGEGLPCWWLIFSNHPVKYSTQSVAVELSLLETKMTSS